MRENVSPKVLEQITWAGSNIGSYREAAEAMRRLAGVRVTIKQMQRITTRVGQACCQAREDDIAEYAAKPLAGRVRPRTDIEPPEVGVVMMDGGRLQRRDHFGQRREAAQGVTHWREDKVGLCLSMSSQECQEDPCPEFPAWLCGAEVVAQIARLGRPEAVETKDQTELADERPSDGDAPWPDAPTLVSREVIASCQCGETFGRHLAWKAWHSAVTAAPRQAFVADGASVNWTIHRQHFRHMTGILDLMHALSYAYRAAEELACDPRQQRVLYAGWAEAIWQGRVEDVICELTSLADQLDSQTPTNTSTDHEPSAVRRAVTYYTHHRERMNYPQYRQQGLPLTSSLMESAIKQINLRVKGSEKFWRAGAADAILQLRADHLSDSQPLDNFWPRWHAQHDGSNRYQTTAA